LLQGQRQLDKIDFPTVNDAAIKGKLNSVMPNIDPTWGNKNSAWEYYESAQWYKGTNLFYFESRVPDSAHDANDMLVFHNSDQIVGIYFVQTVTNEFKGGRWIQKLKARRDLTIPYHAIPKGVTGKLAFEEYMKETAASPDRASERIAAAKQQAEQGRAGELKKESLPSTGTPATKASELNPKVETALQKQKELLAKNPAPVVEDPVAKANELVASGKSKSQAYREAKENYINQVNNQAKHLENINKQAYKEAGVSEYRPYNAQAMAGMAITKSGSGGLEDWKNGVTSTGPAKFNNPSGIGYDSSNNSYYKFDDPNKGLLAANEYFNYGQGVKSVGKQGADRLLMPSDRKGSDISYLNGKLKGGGG
jgi:hypothetical protein